MKYVDIDNLLDLNMLDRILCGDCPLWDRCPLDREPDYDFKKEYNSFFCEYRSINEPPEE